MASDTAQLVKEKLNIVDVLKEYLKVVPAGKNFKANCPFHQEKTPSFMISTERQSWHCFGCSEGGDVISFLMKYENLEFYDALKILAEKAGIDIKASGNRDFNNHNNLYAIMTAAKDYFAAELKKAPDILKYVAERGLKDETVQEFEIGFAPPASDGAMRHLIRLGFAAADIERAGIILKTDRGTYWDRFRGRVMFPLYNHFGKVAGFTGRILPAHDNGAVGKYVNSPETPIFQKSKLAYGLHKTKNDIRLANAVVLVEGQMDFLMAWQDGIKNIVATSGTALTQDHLAVLRRIADTLVVAFDNDVAGAAAMERAIDLAGSLDFSCKVLLVQDVKDPADLAKEQPGKLAELVAQALPAMQYYFYKYITAIKGAGMNEKKRAIRTVLAKISLLESAIERSHWVQELSVLTGVDVGALNEELGNLKKQEGVIQANRKEVPEPEESMSRIDLISRQIISIALRDKRYADIAGPYCEFLPPAYKAAYAQAVRKETADEAVPGAEEIASLASMRSGLEAGDEANLEAELQALCRQVKLGHFKERRQKLAAEIRRAEAGGNDEVLKGFLKEFDLVSREMHNI